MDFDPEQIAQVVDASWGWAMPKVKTVMAVNSMANCLLEDINGHYWRICPEELLVTSVAKSEEQMQSVLANPQQKKDWQLKGLINPAEKQLGPLLVGECYKMVTPAALGGEYAVSNLRIGSIDEYLAFTGEVAFKVKDLEDGDTIEIEFE